MKILFYSSGARRYHFLTILMDEAIELSKQGHDVYFVYNDCLSRVCTENLVQNSDICAKCHRWMKQSLKCMPRSIHKINLNHYAVDNNDVHFVYNSLEDIKKLKYKQVNVGYAILSSYISMTRNLSPIINEETRPFWDKLISASCRLTDALEIAIDTIKPEKMYFFNTRYFEWRPPYDLAVNRGIDIVSLEQTFDANNQRYKVRFVNNTPHSIKGAQKRCDDLWNDEHVGQEEKISIGKSFFEKRRAGVVTNDKVYISSQEKGKLPVNWDKNKHNIVIFNSSEDEFAAIGDEYEQLALFKTQYKGIKYILNRLKSSNQVHIYLRIHPNLADIPYRYHTELVQLEKEYDNITVIPASDSVSTYDMMEAADKVVVFGSSMGLESAYWRKPVILLAGSCYYYSDVCYIPKTKEELSQLLIAKLEPKDNFETIKWGYYFLYRNPDDKCKYVHADEQTFKIFKYEFLNMTHLKLLGSSKLYAIYAKIINRLFRKRVTKSEVPLDEDLNAEL